MDDLVVWLMRTRVRFGKSFAVQGSLTRIDLTFNAGADQIMDGKLYLSCSPAPASLEEYERYFFWYPDVEAVSAWG